MPTQTKPLTLDSVLSFMAPYWGSLSESLGLDEAKKEQRELLNRSIGVLEPFLKDPAFAEQQRYLDQAGEFVSALGTGLDELLDPESELNRARAARIRTSAREQLRTLGQNAAAAGLPQSQRATMNVMRETGDSLAQAPLESLLAALGVAEAGSTAASRAQAGAATLFQSRMTPASQIAQILANTEVTTPLLQPGLSAVGAIGAGLGSYFPRVPGYPWSYLNPTL